MKHLIIYAHPNEGSLNHHLKETIVETLTAGGHEIQIRDLYQLNFDPVLSLEDMNGQRTGQLSVDLKQEQEYISWATHISFIYPIWWTGMPAIMKGYIDRVMTYGFAYRYDDGVQMGLLKGKSATILNTHGKSNEEYQAIGMDKALLLTSDKGIYTYCGLEVKQHFFFDRADKVGAESVLEWISQIKSIYSSKSS